MLPICASPTATAERRLDGASHRRPTRRPLVSVDRARRPAGPEGATCSVATTADAVTSDLVREGQRGIWKVGQVQVFDGGADGDADTTGDNTLFAVQGTFLP